MAKPKPTLSTADLNVLRAQIMQLPPIRWDPIDMDHVFQVDRGLAKQLTALRLETAGEIHRVISEGMVKAARTMK